MEKTKTEYELMLEQLNKWNFNRALNEEDAVSKFWKLKALFDEEKKSKEDYGYRSRASLETGLY